MRGVGLGKFDMQSDDWMRGAWTRHCGVGRGCQADEHGDAHVGREQTGHWNTAALG